MTIIVSLYSNSKASGRPQKNGSQNHPGTGDQGPGTGDRGRNSDP